MLLPGKLVVALGAILFTMMVCANAQAADSPDVIEAFGCTFEAGKDLEDLNEAIDFFKGQKARIGSPEVDKTGSVLWVPYRGRVDVDFVWINTNITLNEWGKAALAYDNSAAGQAAAAKFAKVATCTSSGLALTETLYATDKAFVEDDGVLIESYRCLLNAGKSIADSDDAIDSWTPVWDKAVKATGAASLVFRRTPIISGSGFDLNYVAVWDDVAAFAAGNSAFRADIDSAESGDMFERAHKCKSALFKGRIVVPWES